MENKEVVATKGVKIRNRDQELKEKENTEKENYRAKFNQMADKTVQNYNEKNKKAIEAIHKFITISQDKTLAKNKGAIGIDIEKEIRQELIQIGIDTNNDPSEEMDGTGSIIILSALCKVILLQRDRLNELEFELKKKSS